MSPILVRPVREQLEHDRIIRFLHAKAKRKYDAAMNPGAEKNAAVGAGDSAFYPDLVLHSLERGRRLQAIVEVETGESVNHLEALSEWANFAKTRVAFHLYVPSSMVDVARRLCEDNQIHATEIWSYHGLGDDVRFALVHRARELPPAPRAAATRAKAPAPPAAAARPKPSKPRPAAKAAKPRRVKSPARPAARAKAVKKAARPQKRK